MNRRIVATVVAVLLAVIGGVLLVGYANGADQRAMAGLETTAVLTVAQPVAEGTAAEDLTDLVTLEQLPAKAVAPGAVVDLSELSGLVTTAELQPGEQLLAGRFASPADVTPEIEIPEDMHQVSVVLASERVVGGHLSPGSTVGVFMSLSEKTHLVLNKALVTRVQGGVVPAEPTEGEAAEGATATPAPEGGVMVTLALAAPDVEKVVFGAEHGSLWLSLEPAGAPEDGTRIVTEENVFE